MSAVTGSLTGTGLLLRASLEHDGRRFAPWVVITAFLSSSSVLIFPWVFPTQLDRLMLAGAIGANPALGLIFGPAYDLSTVDGFAAWRSLALGGFLVGLGAIITVVRATRAQEDSGQAELLAAGVVGRSARLMSGVALALVGSVVAGVASCLLTVLLGGDWVSSLLLGATFTASGWMFAGVAAVAAQIGSDARTASSLAVGTLGVLYLLRGLSASLEAPAWTLWANPLGWTLQTRPASGDDWSPLLLAVALTAVLVALAFALQGRRDFGQGVVAQRPGPARGRVRTTGGLAVRLNRGLFATWSIAFLVLGVVFGYFTIAASELLEENASVQQILAAGAVQPEQVTAAFLRTVLSLVGVLACVPGVQLMLKVRAEELEDRVEPVLAGAVARVRYYGGNVLLALAAPALFVLLGGTLVALLAAGGDIGVAFQDTLGQAVATIPAVWTVVALSGAVVGARPGLSLAGWAGVLVSFVLTLLGPTFGLDDWVLGISPFWHVPQVVAPAPDWTGLGWISLVTAALLVVGSAGFRGRDLAR